MTAPLITTTTLTPTAPAATAAGASTAETPGGLGFQPVLAALTQSETAAATTASTAAAAALTLATGAGTAGKPLPPSGDTLPPLSQLVEGDVALPTPTTVAELPVGGETAGLILDELPSAVVAAGDDSELDSGGESVLMAAISAQPLPPAPAAASDTPAVTPSAEPVPQSTAVVTVAAPTMTPASTSTAPVPTPPVAGAVKRLLPESTAKTASAPAVTPAANGSEEGQAGLPTAPSADSAPIFDLAAMTATDDVVASEPSSTPTTTATSIATPRENPLRAYQNAAPIAAQVDVPVGRQGFSEAVLEKVMWFSAQQIGSAEIHLNPAELGPLSVRISTHQDQASVYFTSHHAAVRDAVDQALPRLREMFDSQGIQLLDAGVGEQRHARQQAGTQGEAGSAGLAGDGGDEALEGGVVENSGRTVMVNQRLLDAYA